MPLRARWEGLRSVSKKIILGEHECSKFLGGGWAEIIRKIFCNGFNYNDVM